MGIIRSECLCKVIELLRHYVISRYNRVVSYFHKLGLGLLYTYKQIIFLLI